MNNKDFTDLYNMLDAAAGQRPSDFSDSFGSAMINKMHHAINDKKVELAQTMFNPKPEPDPDEDWDDEDEE